MIDRELIKNRLGDKTVLFVDDDESITKPWEKLLSRSFGKVLIAYNGAEGLQKYMSHKIDIVVSDITMPIMDGVQMAKAIKDSDSESKIIFITGHDKTEHAEAISELGSTLLTKPVDIEEFFKDVLAVF